jgi:hypothetical protein
VSRFSRRRPNGRGSAKHRSLRRRLPVPEKLSVELDRKLALVRDFDVLRLFGVHSSPNARIDLSREGWPCALSDSLCLNVGLKCRIEHRVQIAQLARIERNTALRGREWRLAIDEQLKPEL